LIEPGILFDHFRFPGLAVSTLNAIELSVTLSDNGATDIIYSRVGGPVAVNGWLQSLGLGKINMGAQTVAQTFSNKEGAVPASSLARTATPSAMAELLARLQRGEILGSEQKATILDVMQRTKGERISLQLPPGVPVRHKTGTLFGGGGISLNDVGIIDMPQGGAVAIAVFIKGSPEAVAHSTRDKVIGGISRALYDYFLMQE
jgi:beta-lactamase class A